jgi:cytochrome c
VSFRVRRVPAILAAFAVAVFLGGQTPVEPDDKVLQDQGHALVTKNCAPCHAVEVLGTSPRADAPAFRLLGRRYPVESLEEALGEGIISGHPDMPEFIFTGEDVGAIIAYLKSIQE